jgi:hypothetical protein
MKKVLISNKGTCTVVESVQKLLILVRKFKSISQKYEALNLHNPFLG